MTSFPNPPGVSLPPGHPLQAWQQYWQLMAGDPDKLRQWQQQAGAHADRLPQRGIWRRYSVFLHRGAPLIVTEWFAPEVLDWPIDHRKLTPIRRLQPRIQKQQHRRA